MKQVSQDTVVQAISLLQQGKSIREVEMVTGLSKTAVGRLQKPHFLDLESQKAVDPSYYLRLMKAIVCAK